MNNTESKIKTSLTQIIYTNQWIIKIIHLDIIRESRNDYHSCVKHTNVVGLHWTLVINIPVEPMYFCYSVSYCTAAPNEDIQRLCAHFCGLNEPIDSSSVSPDLLTFTIVLTMFLLVTNKEHFSELWAFRASQCELLF